MSSIPELLKEAHEKKDWNLVGIVYHNLTGIRLAANDNIIHQPKQQYQSQNGPVPMQQLVLPSSEDNYQMPTQENKKYCTSESINLSKSKLNLFTDDGRECAKDKLSEIRKTDGNLYEKMTSFTPKVNKGSDMVNVICRQCSKPQTVSQALVNNKNKFLCDRCISGKR